MPPPEQLASRILLNPMLRLQPDRRLVALVREGYEGAFEEIVRRYRRPLDRFAAAIVGARSEDVTQDAFSKALLALRGAESEIELRPWLYRIVRNTALNDLRDSPPPTEQLAESLRGGESAAATAERRAELAELVQRLRALPEPQRAAIVMRELEGLSHEEIAAALGVSGGAARQAIYRARAALRDGLGALLPLPLLRTLLDHFGEAGGGVAASVGAASAAGAGAAASGTLGGLGAGGALKIGAATILLAGGVGAGIAIKHHDGRSPQTAAAASPRESPAATAGSNGGPAPLVDGGGGRAADISTGSGSPGANGGSGDGSGRGGGSGQGGGPSSGPGPAAGGGSGAAAGPTDGNGSHSGSSGPREDHHGGPGPSGGGHGGEEGTRHAGGGEDGSRHGGGDHAGEVEGGGGSQRSSRGDGQSSGGGEDEVQAPQPPPTAPTEASEEDGGGSGSGSGSSGSSDSGSGSGTEQPSTELTEPGTSP